MAVVQVVISGGANTTRSRIFVKYFVGVIAGILLGGYGIELGRATTVGDMSGDTNECCCVEAACG